MVELGLRLKLDGETGEVMDAAEAKVKEVVWESDPDMWRWASEEFAKTTAMEVCDWVLDVKLNVSK